VNARLLQLLVQARLDPLHRDDRPRRRRQSPERQRRHRPRAPSRAAMKAEKLIVGLRHARHPPKRERPREPRQPPDVAQIDDMVKTGVIAAACCRRSKRASRPCKAA
jgi:hypothetical protein